MFYINFEYLFTVPPQKPVILSEYNEEIEHTGPYFEGDRVKLTCMVSGGNIIFINFLIFHILQLLIMALNINLLNYYVIVNESR